MIKQWTNVVVDAQKENAERVDLGKGGVMILKITLLGSTCVQRQLTNMWDGQKLARIVLWDAKVFNGL
jgi:hypothetical protein